MPNVNFELNLNQHPKNIPNRSLINARNVQLSNDLSCLQSEFAIKGRSDLDAILTDKYIAGYIPCNKEFILFIAPKDYKTQLTNHPEGILIDIYRYKEQGDLSNDSKGSFDNAEGYVCYDKFVWHGGELKGTFTYNIKSHLIIAVAESDTITGDYIPLKTINLGEYGDTEDVEDTDLMLDDSQLSFNPEIKIPAIIGYNYTNGLAYKGWYTFFIRYKINSIDYTKWYSIGFPILIDETEQVTLFNYFIHSDGTQGEAAKKYYGEGIIDNISSGSNTCNKTIELTIDHKENNFKYYQLGIIQSTKTDERAFKTLDIDINNETFLLNFSSLEEHSVNDFVFEKYNYYNVKNVINYKNRLYFSNYKEKLEENIDLDFLASSFYVRIQRKTFNYRAEENTNHSTMNFVLNIDRTNGVTINNNVSTGSFNFNCDISGNYVYNSKPLKTIGVLVSLGSSYSSILHFNINLFDLYPKPFMDVGTHHYDNVTKEVNILNNKIRISLNNIVITTTSSTINPGDPGDPLDFDVEATISATVNIVFYLENDSPYKHRLKNTTLLPGETYKFYIHFVNKYGEYTDGIPIEGAPEHVSDNPQYSYGIPNNDKSVTIYGGVENKYDIVNSTCYVYYPTIIVNSSIGKEAFLSRFGKYVGFFITYEKFQKTKQFTGIVTRYDFPYERVGLNTRYYEYILDSAIKDSDNKHKFRFYCTDIDTKDVLQLNFTKLILESNNFNKLALIGSNDIKEVQYANNGNIDESNTTLFNSQSEHKILNATYISAHNFSKGNDYYGGYIELEFENPTAFLDALGLTPEQQLTPSDNLKLYLCKAILVADNTNLYLSENKTLIKFTNTYYFSEMEFNSRGINRTDQYSENIDVVFGLNGFTTFNTALIYNYNKVILNSGYNLLLTRDYYSYISSDQFKIDGTADDKIESEIKLPFVAYYTYIDYNDYPYESRCFKTLPEIFSIRSEAISDKVSQAIFAFDHATIVLPMNSSDLFQNKIGSQDNNVKKTYINYNQKFIYSFDKRIIRSNPIADESFENSWRIVNPESYRDITENKGNITNMVALGTTFLVHTEHGLFMFDRDNTLQNGNGNSIQLGMPDVFDIDYKELIASPLGSCGLQDSKAWIVDDFGYIFYDNDAHRFYKFGSKNIEIIDGSIEQFINKYKPYKVRFINDSESNRIIVAITYQISSTTTRMKDSKLTLSYNTKINKWISFHDYTFDRGFSTKQMTYFILDKQEAGTTNIISNIYLINRTNIVHQNKPTVGNLTYSQFDNIRDSSQIETIYSSLSIIVNDSYEVIKTLEYLTWKLYKIKPNLNAETEYNFKARENLREPYSGYTIRVYNDKIDTGVIDINCDTINNENRRNTSVMNYKKPWWQFDNWNFNYLRDIKNASPNLRAQFMSRLYGNYFVIELTFNDDSNRIEFETLDCKLIANRTI